MNKILLIILLSVSAYSDANLTNWSVSGELNTIYFGLKQDMTKGKNIDEKGVCASIQMDIKYKNDGFFFNATPFAHYFDLNSGRKLRNNNFDYAFKDHDIFFRSLYMSYTTGDFTYGFGILPLSNAFPMEFTDDYYADGEGLSIINDINLLSAFVKYQINPDNDIMLAYHQVDTGFVNVGKYSNEHIKDKTKGFGIIQNIKDGKYKMVNQLFFIDTYYDGEPYGEILNLGTGISWDDSEYSGWSLYGSFGVSTLFSNSANIKDVLLGRHDGQGQGPGQGQGGGIEDKFPYIFDFTTDNRYGAASLLGFRYDIDELFGMGSFVNAEWFHTFNDWVSGNHGEPYSSNCNQLYNIRDNSYFVQYGVILADGLQLSVSYTYLEFEEAIKHGSPASYPAELSPYPVKTNTEIIKLQLTYKF